MEARVQVTETFLERFATGTLVGTLVTENPGFGMPGDTATLVFHTSSLHYCERNGGPRAVVMQDYTPMCLVQDVCRLLEMGVTLRIEEFKRD
jgi:hypothetical protein